MTLVESFPYDEGGSVDESLTQEVAMKKSLSLVCLMVVGLALILLAETVAVKVQSTNLRKDPKFYAEAVALLKAGESVERINTRDGWVQVRTSQGVVGWVHSSALEARKFSLLAMDKGLKTQATTAEVALAGKGFNKQVEESYRAKHGDLSFVWVDGMLKIKISPARVEEFLKQGKLGEFRRGK